MLYCYNELDLDEVYVDTPNWDGLVNDVLGENAPRNCDLDGSSGCENSDRSAKRIVYVTSIFKS